MKALKAKADLEERNILSMNQVNIKDEQVQETEGDSQKILDLQ